MITLKVNIRKKSKLLFKDTDSLTYEIKTEDVYEDYRSNEDLSNYSTKSKHYDNSNKLIIGKMKDETGNSAIEELFGMNPKMYSFLVNNCEHKKVKGSNKNAVVTINHDQYKAILLMNV